MYNDDDEWAKRAPRLQSVMEELWTIEKGSMTSVGALIVAGLDYSFRKSSSFDGTEGGLLSWTEWHQMAPRSHVCQFGLG